MRYVSPVTADLEREATELRAEGEWTIDELWLTCGANWYGMKGRIEEFGPLKIPLSLLTT
jgi:hypothetical protein